MTNKTDRRRKRRRQDYRDALRRVLATATPQDVREGHLWYRRAMLWADEVGTTLGFTLAEVAGVTAALSPRNNWERNKTDATNILTAVSLKTHPLPVATFKVNRDAALRIAKGEPWQSVLKGRKVRAFASALAGNAEATVVDVWMARAMTDGRRDAPRSAADYEDMAAAIRYVARQRGEPVTQTQATAWVAARNAEGAR